MKKWIAKKVDIEIGSGLDFSKKIVVKFLNRTIAVFKIEPGSTEIKRI